MPRKYELVEASSAHTIGHTFYRVKALRDFGDVHAGDVGGWIEDDTCLSQDGSAWVYGNARVYGNAEVHEFAEVYGSANIAEHAQGEQP